MVTFEFCENIYDNVKVGDVVVVGIDESCAEYVIRKKRHKNKTLDIESIRTKSSFKEVPASVFSYIVRYDVGMA